MKDQVKELATVMKAGTFLKMSHPPADKKNKGNQNNQNCNRNNQRKNGNRTQNRDNRDIRSNFLGPTANVSGPFLMDKDPSNVINPKDGRHPQRIFSSRGNLNFVRGKSEAGRNSSPRTRADRILNQEPGTKTVVWKAVHPIQRYHNPNALVRSIGPFNESPVLIEGQKFTGGELGQYM